MDFIIGIIGEVICYKLGLWFLKIVTLGRFSDDKGAYWIALVGFFVLVLIMGFGIYVIRK